MYKVFTVCFFLSVFIVIACNKDEWSSTESVNRTIIVYMAAENDLSANNLIVFVDITGKPPYLLKIDEKKETIIKLYSELDSADRRL